MILVALCFVWAGMVLNISFLETPVKFTAPSITLPIGLDVGRHVFGVFNKLETGAALFACVLIIVNRSQRAVWLPMAFVIAAVVLQTVWLLPVLDARVELILRGDTPPQAAFHVIYVLLELLKVGALLAAGRAGLAAMRLPK
jgi:hypothetical protein